MGANDRGAIDRGAKDRGAKDRGANDPDPLCIQYTVNKLNIHLIYIIDIDSGGSKPGCGHLPPGHYGLLVLHRL